MRFAVSNIAWPVAEDCAVAAALGRFGVAAIEVAPTRYWPNLGDASDREVGAVRRFWNERGIEIVAAQSLLFGRPDLVLFGSGETRTKMFDHLAHVIRLGARLGAGSLVFGSPRNRRIEATHSGIARDIAIDFFGQLAEVAHAEGTAIVLEANPCDYGADFITRAAEAIDLVRAVNHPGFRLHLDTGCMLLAGDPVRETLEDGFRFLRHFHISEPQLGFPGSSGRIDHAAFASELANCGYGGWVSLEMREPDDFSIASLTAAVQWAVRSYEPALTITQRAAG